jgi:hypothetical protein
MISGRCPVKSSIASFSCFQNPFEQKLFNSNAQSLPVNKPTTRIRRTWNWDRGVRWLEEIVTAEGDEGVCPTEGYFL